MQKKRWALVGGVAFVILALVGVGLTRLLSMPWSPLDQAQARWRNLALRHYRLLVEGNYPFGCQYEVDVQDEVITRILKNECYTHPLSVGDMFATIRARSQMNTCGPNGCACDGPVGVVAEYDPVSGYPRQWEIRTLPNLRWRTLEYWTRRFSGVTGCTLVGFIGTRLTVRSVTPLP